MTRESMTRAAAARVRPWLAVAALAALAACAEGGRSEYSQDADTGAAAPAAAPDQSTARMIGPDSGPGPGARTGEPGVAGDTLGSRGERGERTDPAARAGADSARADSLRRATRPPR